LTHCLYIPEGLGFDMTLRAAELCLALARERDVRVYARKMDADALWWRLLDTPRQRQLRRLMAGKPEVTDASSGQIRKIFLCTAATAPRFPQPASALLLLTAYELDAAPVSLYDRVYAIASPYRGERATAHKIIFLPCPVDARVFAPASSVKRSDEVLVVADGDEMRAIERIRELGEAGVRRVVLFDPYRAGGPRADLLPDGISARYVGAIDSKERAKLFRRCRAAVHVGSRIDQDDHFLGEAASAGASLLSRLVDDVRPGDIWTKEKLATAVARIPQKASGGKKSELTSFADLAGRICKDLDAMAATLPTPDARATSSTPEPRVLVRGQRPGDMSRGPLDHIGANVACDLIFRALQLTSKGRFDIVWYDRQFHTLGANANRNRLYFYPVQAQGAEARDQADSASLQNWLTQDRVQLLLNTDPYVGGFLAARTLWARRAVPIIGMLHSIHMSEMASEAVFQLLSGPTYPCDGFISPTHCGAKAFASLYAEAGEWLAAKFSPTPQFQGRHHVVPYGIDASFFSGRNRTACRLATGLPADDVILLSTGRFHRHEKSDLLPLLLAVKYLRNCGNPVTLALCGASSGKWYLELLETTCRDLGIADAVRFFFDASAQDKVLLYGAADVFVTVSDSVQETYGLVLLEAMAAGLPVVASAWNGHREIVRHGDSGFLVPTYWGGVSDDTAHLHRIITGISGQGHGDLNESVAVDMPALCSCLVQLITNRELRESMGARGQRICRQDYDLETQGHKLVEICSDAMQTAKATPWQPANAWSRPFADLVGKRFAHYASHAAGPDTWVHMTKVEHARAWEKTALDICGAGGGLEGVVARAILATVVQSSGRIRLGTLEEKICAKFPLDVEACRRRILRCAKYGLIQMMEQ